MAKILKINFFKIAPGAKFFFDFASVFGAAGGNSEYIQGVAALGTGN